jgi:uncharacterized repeat protein (TIGR01451 family)
MSPQALSRISPTASAGGVDSNEDDVTVPRQLPELTVTKTNNTSNAGTVGVSFNWILTVSNTGLLDATFTNGQTLLSDPLPAGATYGTPAAGSFTGITNSSDISCSIDGSNVLTCVASGSDITIGANTGTFSVTIPVTPTTGGNLENTATVDPNNNITESNETNNTGTNTVFVAAPALTISKQVSANVGGPWSESITVDVGDTVYYQITVDNTGNTALTGVTVDDDMAGCTLSSPSGDTNTNSILDTNETWVYTCSVTAVAGTQTNTATADSNETDEETDDAEYFGNAPALTISKQVSANVGGPWSESITVDVGDMVYYQITVDNTGNTALTNVTVNDGMAGCTLNGPSGDTNTNSILETNETWVYTCSVTAVAGTQTNTADVTTTELLTPEEDDAEYFGNAPALTIVKEVSANVGGPWSESITVDVGDTVYYQITVDNTGNTALTGVTVDDDMAGCTLSSPSGDTNTNSILETNETWVYTCSVTAVAGTQTNTATADSNETDEETDDAEYFSNAPALTISKQVSANVGGPWSESITVDVGDTVYYQITVDNTGNTALTGVTVDDDMAGCTLSSPSGDTNTNSILDTDETWVYTCSVTAVAGAQTNTATADSNETDEETDDAEYFGSAPAMTISKNANVSSVDAAGNLISYTITITNTGNVLLTGVDVSDPMLTDLDCDAVSIGYQTTGFSIPVDGSLICTGSYSVTTTDISTNGGGDGDIDNTASVVSTQITTPQDSSEEVDIEPADLSLTKTVDNSSPVVGNNVVFTITAPTMAPQTQLA